MFSLSSNLTFYLFAKATDMRKSFDSLSQIIVNQIKRNPLSVEMFINKPRNKMKLFFYYNKRDFEREIIPVNQVSLVWKK